MKKKNNNYNILIPVLIIFSCTPGGGLVSIRVTIVAGHRRRRVVYQNVGGQSLNIFSESAPGGDSCRNTHRPRRRVLQTVFYVTPKSAGRRRL